MLKMWRKGSTGLRKSLMRRDPAWGYVTRIHGSWHQTPLWKPGFFYSLPPAAMQFSGSGCWSWASNLCRASLSPFSMPIVYRGLHRDIYLGVHWSHFDFPLSRSPNLVELGWWSRWEVGKKRGPLWFYAVLISLSESLKYEQVFL